MSDIFPKRGNDLAACAALYACLEDRGDHRGRGHRCEHGLHPQLGWSQQRINYGTLFARPDRQIAWGRAAAFKACECEERRV